MAHFEIKHPYTVIQPFWAISTAVHTVKASKKNLRLRLRHSRNRKPTVYVWPIPVTVWRAPLGIVFLFKALESIVRSYLSEERKIRR